MNMHKDTSMGKVWDASKAYMRGTLIYLNNAYRRKQMQKCKDLEEEIKQKEKEFILNPLERS